MLKKFMIAISTVFLAVLCAHSTVHAQDKQGKRSLETNKARQKENRPSQSGAQRVQDQTKTKTDKAVRSNGADRTREKTRQSVAGVLRKK
jgi:hypothetical protein